MELVYELLALDEVAGRLPGAGSKGIVLPLDTILSFSINHFFLKNFLDLIGRFRFGHFANLYKSIDCFELHIESYF